MGRNTRYLVQRADGEFWNGVRDWTPDPKGAAKFHTKPDALLEFTLYYGKVLDTVKAVLCPREAR